jgi:hypothetical protein
MSNSNTKKHNASRGAVRLVTHHTVCEATAWPNTLRAFVYCPTVADGRETLKADAMSIAACDQPYLGNCFTYGQNIGILALSLHERRFSRRPTESGRIRLVQANRRVKFKGRHRETLLRHEGLAPVRYS